MTCTANDWLDAEYSYHLPRPSTAIFCVSMTITKKPIMHYGSTVDDRWQFSMSCNLFEESVFNPGSVFNLRIVLIHSIYYCWDHGDRMVAGFTATYAIPTTCTISAYHH
jgi:hypothetical protein